MRVVKPRDVVFGEAIEELVDHEGWRAIVARYNQMIEKKKDELTQPLDMAATERARGFIEGVRACLRAPKTAIEELKRP